MRSTRRSATGAVPAEREGVAEFECVYPMVPAGAAISEMVLGPPKPVAV